LIVEAPAGVLTPDIRAELVKRKAALICALQRVQVAPLIEDPLTRQSLHKVAYLLAVAFQRYAEIQRVPIQQPEDAVTKELALSPPESVHGRG
jgi:TubC N-terminal docking domain